MTKKLEIILLIAIIVVLITLIAAPIVSRTKYESDLGKYIETVQNEAKECRDIFSGHRSDFEAVVKFFEEHPEEIETFKTRKLYYDVLDEGTDGACSRILDLEFSYILPEKTDNGFDVVFMYEQVNFTYNNTSSASSKLGIVFSSENDVTKVKDVGIRSSSGSLTMGDGFYFYEIDYV